MSTRCQVQVYQGPESWEKVTLYRHCDGYPTGMLPLFVEAFDHFKDADYRLGRAGHAAAFLCFIEPEQFEPEAGHDLHGDIEWYYRLHVASPEGLHIGAKQQWEVEVFQTRHDAGTPDNPGRRVLDRTEVHAAAELADSIEKKAYNDEEEES